MRLTLVLLVGTIIFGQVFTLIGFDESQVYAQEVKMDSLLIVKMAELQDRWETFEVEQAKIAYAHQEFAKFQVSIKPKEVEEAKDE